MLGAFEPWMPAVFFLCLALFALAVAHRQRRTIRTLQDIALTDEITGLGNLKRFYQWGNEVVRRGDYVYVSMDINNFKTFNAYYGHTAGNGVLQHLACVLRFFLHEDEVLCRGAGDEFLMLLHWPGDMEKFRQRLRVLEYQVQSMDNPVGRQRISLTLSFGIYHMGDPAVSLRVGGDRAATARKLSKNAYHASYGVYDEVMHARLTQERQFEQEMAGAQERGEFFVRLQPKCDLRHGRVLGAEALIRWQHPDKNEVPPSDFVPLFEKNGFIVHLDMFVIDYVCRVLRRWTDAGLSPLPISVNMSRLHALDSDFVSRIKSIIRSYRLPPALIELELTETAFLQNTTPLLRIMEELSAFGVQFSMDDFGTGYSSLNMLKEIPVQVLKLDRAFLMNVDNMRCRNIILHVVHMAKDLNMSVVCEGVESAWQVEFLRAMHCDAGQGFFFAPPLRLEEFERWAFPHWKPENQDGEENLNRTANAPPDRPEKIFDK